MNVLITNKQETLLAGLSVEIIKTLRGEFEAEEIIAELPYQMTKLQLSAAIRDLRDREFIKVKYFTPDEYCLLTVKTKEEAPVVDGGEVYEATAVTTVQKTEKVKPASSKKAFWMGFLGAFLGSGVVMSIAIVLLELVFK